jgi:hypothetical protein
MLDAFRYRLAFSNGKLRKGFISFSIARILNRTLTKPAPAMVQFPSHSIYKQPAVFSRTKQLFFGEI